MEQLLLRSLAPASIEGQRAVGCEHLAVGMGQQEDLGSLQAQDPPAFKEVAVMADRGPDPAITQLEHAPFIGLAKAEELIERRMDLSLYPDHAVGSDEGVGVIVGSPKVLAESIGDDDLAAPRLVVDRPIDRPIGRLGPARDLRRAVVSGD